MLTVEQVMQSNKAAFETVFGSAYGLFGHGQALAELNIATAKRAFEASGAYTNELLSTKDVQGFMALQTGAAQPLVEGLQAYRDEVTAIAKAAGADVTKAIETQAAKLQAQTESYFDTASKNAPAGMEGIFTMGKSFMEAQQRMGAYAQDAVTKATGMIETAVKQANASVENVTAIGTKAAKRK
jgi:phasin family protein